MKKLINNQSVRIDDHFRGAKEIKELDKPSKDVHIDKETMFKIDGKKRKVRIKIPLNSNREIQISTGRNKLSNVPAKLRKEIQKALSDKEKRTSFVNDILNNINNYESMLSQKEKASLTLDKLAKHFELKWTKQEISTYANDVLKLHTRIYTDSNNLKYRISLNSKRILIKEVTNKSNHAINISKQLKE